MTRGWAGSAPSIRRRAFVPSADPGGRSDPYIESVSNRLLANLLAEPAVADPPRRVWRDWLLVGGIIVAALLEGTFREDLVWGPWSMILVVLLGLTPLWRRRYPLAMTAVTLGTFIVLDEVARIVEDEPVESFTAVFVLVHVYALFRWGSGRHCAYGLGIMAAAYVTAMITAWTGVGDAIGGAIVFLFPAVLGAEVRHLGQRRERDREEVKALERELLARDLHDTVAHHVSAIAVQAQAGRVVGAKNPGAALEALAVIEAEASRTLAEMRTIVGTLRDGRSPASAEFAPQTGIDDIARFAETAAGSGPAVTVDIRNVDHIGPTIGAALYRIAQEAVTNARRHAVDATRVTISVVGEDEVVRLTVVDDGTHRRTGFDTAGGFGLIGMTERAELLGGTLRAGPDGARGWRVDAIIPLGATR